MRLHVLTQSRTAPRLAERKLCVQTLRVRPCLQLVAGTLAQSLREKDKVGPETEEGAEKSSVKRTRKSHTSLGAGCEKPRQASGLESLAVMKRVCPLS